MGVLLAIAGAPLLTRLVPPSLPVAEASSIDFRALLFAALLSGGHIIFIQKIQ